MSPRRRRVFARPFERQPKLPPPWLELQRTGRHTIVCTKGPEGTADFVITATF